MRIKNVIAVLAFAILSGSLAEARQAQIFVSKVEKPCNTDNPSNIAGSFRIKNITDLTLELKVEDERTNDYVISYTLSQKVLRPNEDAVVAFTGALFNEGKYQVNANVIAYMDDEVVGSHSVDMYFLVQDKRVRASNYEELFLKPDVVDKEMGASFNSFEDRGEFKRSDDYQKRMPAVQKMIEMDPNAIFKIPTRSFGPDCPGDCSGNPNDPNEGLLRNKMDDADHVSKVIDGPRPEFTTLARGEFSYRGMDNLLHPAFGWKVRAWKRVLGIWVMVAEDWIQWDGKWALNVPTLPGDTQFQYVAFNRFFTPMNSSNDTYRWVGPVRATLAANHNEGSWSANTSTGAVRGLGEVYKEGMVLWSQLYWEGGINPLRGSSIKVYFPNTSYDCGDGSGVPWSCASSGGTIWLIPSHASRNGVMQHELSHQITYQYWGGAPSGSGGGHSLGSCYNPGLAVMEGFANFMVFWTQAGRGDDPNAGFDFRVENPSFACASPNNVNESWVAAALWDLHDTRGDGSDNLWFIHPGAVPGIFLRNGMKSGLAALYPIYRSSANPAHRTIIDGIFTQNNIIP